MIVRKLAAPIGPALGAAATALAVAPAGTAEEWQLPDGNHALPADLALDVTGRSVRLRGSDAVSLAFAAGGLAITGASVELVQLAIDAAAGVALRVTASQIALTDVKAASTLATGAIAIDLIGGAGRVDLETISVARAQGGDAIGVRAIGGSVRCTGATVTMVTGANVIGVQLGAIVDLEATEIEVTDLTATGSAIGALVVAGGALEIARLSATDLTGASAIGVAALGFGTGAGAPPNGLSVLDLDLERITATTRATGAFIAAPREIVVRGFTVANVSGAEATGAVVLGGRSNGATGTDLEVGFGSITRIVASGGDVAGLRVIATPSPRPVIVRDVAVSEIAGAPVPATAVPPRDADGDSAWQSWAAAALADLGDDTTPRSDAPVLLDAHDVVGLAVTSVVEDVQPFLDELVAGDVAVVDCTVRVVSGSAIQAEVGLRPVWIRRTEVSTALRAGYLQSDQLVIANATWDRLGAPLAVANSEVRAYDSIFSRVAGGSVPVVLDADSDWGETKAVYADATSDHFAAYGALPYVSAGDPAMPAALVAGNLPPPDPIAIDLSLVPSSTLNASAVAPPPDELELTDDVRLYVGAEPPAEPATCNLYDPLPPKSAPLVEDTRPSPVVDYRARDAKSLLAVMMGRADQVMAPWTDRGAADFTTMVLETVAERLDQIAYQQERATAEGFLGDARLRRSVEDHVRPLDYDVDPGLSATAMLRFTLDMKAISELIGVPDPNDAVVEIPTGTLVANQRNDDQVIVFATEEPLAYAPLLDAIPLVDDLPFGATRAVLEPAPEAIARIAIGRWLVLLRGPGLGGHVVRITTLERGTDTIEIGWDPRRPLPWPLAKGATVCGNVAPAHHGVPLSGLPADVGNPDLARFRELLAIKFDGSAGPELVLPFSPVSVQASGFPLPGDEGRRGAPAIRVFVEDDEWTRVDDLSVALAGDQVFVLRSSVDGRATLRFGNGVSGAALPKRTVDVRLDLSIGTGAVGNVGEAILQRLLYVPVDASRGPISGWLFREDMDVLRTLVKVDNPLAAVGGRDPESIDHMRYHAPLLAQRPLSAITPEDYERVALALPDVAGAHARIVPAAVRPVVSVTVLLRDEDMLDADERLRRWVAVRAALEHARLLGFDVESVPPMWAPLDLDITVDAHPHADAGVVREAVIAAIAGNGGLLDPDTSGLGGDVQLANVYRAALAAHGVAAVRVQRFRRLQPHAPERLHAGFIRIRPDEVAVVRGPARPAADGVLSVTVCGGLR